MTTRKESRPHLAIEAIEAIDGGHMNLSRLSARDLEEEARALEHQLKKLAHRPRPTPQERQLSAELKKLRLAMKDRLSTLERS